MDAPIKKANHQANIVKVTELKTHSNADTLYIIPIGEYQVVSKMGQFNVGDLAVYIQPDSVVPQTEAFKFIWEKYVNPFTPDDPISDRHRRITVRKFRGEWSEGLLMPVTDFPELLDSQLTGQFVPADWPEGTDVSDVLNIKHYDPDSEQSNEGCGSAPKIKRRYPRSLRGWCKFLTRKIKNVFGFRAAYDGDTENISLGIPVYDVDALKNHPNVFIEHEPVIVTEKIHGSNARYIFLDGVMYAGSRKLWKASDSKCIFRRAIKELPWIEEWCRAHEGYVLWGEVTPTQGKYDYGSKDIQFFVFDIRTPDGKWLDQNNPEWANLATDLIGKSVPVLYEGPYDVEKIKTLVDGPSTVINAKHIREGIVIKSKFERHVRGSGRAQLKIVSNVFLEKDVK